MFNPFPTITPETLKELEKVGEENRKIYEDMNRIVTKLWLASGFTSLTVFSYLLSLCLLKTHNTLPFIVILSASMCGAFYWHIREY